MSPRKGEGIKESDGSKRDYPIYCRLPYKKVKIIDAIAKKKSISRTDAISESVNLWISENSVYLNESIDISIKD